MNVKNTELDGILIFEPKLHRDSRGFFQEVFQSSRYEKVGVLRPFVQDNWSRSTKGVLRGLHYQLNFPQSKLVFVIRGAIWDVVVDIRRGSPNFGRSISVHLTEENHRQIYIPRGFAHGFCVLSDIADVIYKCDDFYHPDDEYGVLWSDPWLGLDWPLEEAFVSDKDAKYRPLMDIDPDLLPEYAPAKGN